MCVNAISEKFAATTRKSKKKKQMRRRENYYTSIPALDATYNIRTKLYVLNVFSISKSKQWKTRLLLTLFKGQEQNNNLKIQPKKKQTNVCECLKHIC